MKADHKAAFVVAKETNVRHPMDEVELIKAAYLELRELAKAVANTAGEDDSLWPEMKALRAAIGEE